jgi:hypothetical protein
MNRFPSFVRFLVVAAFSLAFAVSAPQAGWANGDSWTVEKVTGSARIIPVGGKAVALAVGQAVSAGDEVETGADGQLVLVRGEASITVSPASRMSLPEAPRAGLTTTIVQKLGTLLLKVNRKPQQHFEVSTPYLAAVVKGTTFTVSVDGEGAAVHVVEGLVEVSDVDTRQTALVRPGQTATTGSTPGNGLSVGGGSAPASSPSNRGDAGRDGDDATPGDSANAPGQIRKAVIDDAAPGNGKARGVAIREALATGAIDIPKVTNGLVGSVDTPRAAIGGNGKGRGNADGGTDSNGNGNGIAAGAGGIGSAVPAEIARSNNGNGFGQGGANNANVNGGGKDAVNNNGNNGNGNDGNNGNNGNGNGG